VRACEQLRVVRVLWEMEKVCSDCVICERSLGEKSGPVSLWFAGEGRGFCG
jgi:hypothetical protein